MLLTINNINDINSLKQEMKNGDWVILYYATWCGACQMMKPEWDTFTNKIKENNKYRVAVVESRQLPLVSSIDENVNHFPLLKKYKKNGSILEFKNSMNQKEFMKFCKSSSKKPSTKRKQSTKRKPSSSKKPSTKRKRSKRKPSTKRKPSGKKSSGKRKSSSKKASSKLKKKGGGETCDAHNKIWTQHLTENKSTNICIGISESNMLINFTPSNRRCLDCYIKWANFVKGE